MTWGIYSLCFFLIEKQSAKLLWEEMEKKGVLEEAKVEKSLETETEKEEEEERKVQTAEEEPHPYAFHVSGPRNVMSPNWRDLINSSWKDENYKRTVMACFIQGVYLLELDRQENRLQENALAPKWWMSFKYRLSRTLIDERDGSVFGAMLEWDKSAALADLVLIRPSGAPRAVLALRGTLLKSLTILRDIQDFLAWESLKGSVRFSVSLEALRSVVESYGSNNVCIVGHSLGAGFALQVRKALAKEGLYVDAHLFNPPSVSIATSLGSIGEKAGITWKRLRSMLTHKGEDQTLEDAAHVKMGLMNWLPRLHWNKASNGRLQKWVPHLYVNDSDYICCHYSQADQQSDGPMEGDPGKENVQPENKEQTAAKLFVSSKGKQRFMEAHGLEQWWSEGLQLQLALNNSRLINRQLESLYPENNKSK